MIITSPPYNIGKSYEAKTTIEQYLESQQEIIQELIRADGHTLERVVDQVARLSSKRPKTATVDRGTKVNKASVRHR